MHKFLVGLGGLVALLAIDATLVLWYGFLVSTLWGWFVVPLGLPVLSIAHAAGLSWTLSTIIRRTPNSDTNKSYTERVIDIVSGAFGAGITALAVGYIVKGFM